MAIRTKKYQLKQIDPKAEPVFVRAVKITEKNLEEIVAYITRNRGKAFATEGADNKPVRIRIKQTNMGENWCKYDWRVAKVGDMIIRYDDLLEYPDYPYVFARIKEADFNNVFELVK